uniref:CSON008029 protein n=1 Tax=Culicoides sonorensis TaxID=179676 RepID=A0A336MXV1_CULSO
MSQIQGFKVFCTLNGHLPDAKFENLSGCDTIIWFDTDFDSKLSKNWIANSNSHEHLLSIGNNQQIPDFDLSQSNSYQRFMYLGHQIDNLVTSGFHGLLFNFTSISLYSTSPCNFMIELNNLLDYKGIEYETQINLTFSIVLPSDIELECDLSLLNNLKYVFIENESTNVMSIKGISWKKLVLQLKDDDLEYNSMRNNTIWAIDNKFEGVMINFMENYDQTQNKLSELREIIDNYNDSHSRTNLDGNSIEIQDINLENTAETSDNIEEKQSRGQYGSSQDYKSKSSSWFNMPIKKDTKKEESEDENEPQVQSGAGQHIEETSEDVITTEILQLTIVTDEPILTTPETVFEITTEIASTVQTKQMRGQYGSPQDPNSKSTSWFNMPNKKDNKNEESVDENEPENLLPSIEEVPSGSGQSIEDTPEDVTTTENSQHTIISNESISTTPKTVLEITTEIASTVQTKQIRGQYGSSQDSKSKSTNWFNMPNKKDNKNEESVDENESVEENQDSEVIRSENLPMSTEEVATETVTPDVTDQNVEQIPQNTYDITTNVNLHDKNQSDSDSQSTTITNESISTTTETLIETTTEIVTSVQTKQSRGQYGSPQSSKPKVSGWFRMPNQKMPKQAAIETEDETIPETQSESEPILMSNEGPGLSSTENATSSTVETTTQYADPELQSQNNEENTTETTIIQTTPEINDEFASDEVSQNDGETTTVFPETTTLEESMSDENDSSEEDSLKFSLALLWKQDYFFVLVEQSLEQLSLSNDVVIFLLPSCFSGVAVQSKKLPDTDKSPASLTEDRRLFVPLPIGVPSPCILCDRRFLFLLLKLIGYESLLSDPGVFAMLSRIRKSELGFKSSLNNDED